MRAETSRYKVRPDKHRRRFTSSARSFGKPPRPRDGQRRVDAVLTRQVIGRRDHTSTLAFLGIGAHRHRKAPQVRVIALLHRGIERIRDVTIMRMERRDGLMFGVTLLRQTINR